MAKHSSRKPATPVVSSKKATQALDFFLNVRLQSWLIFAFAVVLYANTLRHGFVLDDGIVITENSFVKEGVAGSGKILSHDTFFGFFNDPSKETLVSGGRYRPLSLVSFALIYQLFGENAFVFHLFTVLLFAAACVLFYRTVLKLLNPDKLEAAYKIAWLAAVLFAVHPVHTEVVANIKSCDEIMALLGSLGALYFSLKAWDSGQRKWAVAAGLTFFAACLSKENAVAYVVLIPLALWIFRSSETGGAPNIRSILVNALPVALAFVAFFALRGSILPWSNLINNEQTRELLNNPFLKFEGGQWVDFSASERLATVFYTLWKYVQLLFLPHPLTHDYYPRHIDIMGFGNPFVLLGVAVYAFLAIWAVRAMLRRDASALAIGMFLLPLGIVSNLLFTVGTNMSERFLFMPSAGFCLLIGWLLILRLPANLGWVKTLFGVIALLFAIKTISRNFVWESNANLFKTDIDTSPNSLKLQMAYAESLLARAKAENNSEVKRELCREALEQIEKGFKIYPDFKTAYILRAGAYLTLQRYAESISDYRKALTMAPEAKQRKIMLAFAEVFL